MKVLVVEDEDALAKVLAEKLTLEGFEVKVASMGNEVMPITKSFKPELILLDILLPGKNGVDILAELKKEESLARTPVIMLSNLDSEESIKQSLALGAADYFVKSQHMIKEIVEKVKEYSTKGV